ncbi:MAG: phosphatidate cytidylyltransferase [Actinobacteria bacterium]|nr:phosphatidate cytidylyltransferase [Actinomycetota bacterium]
MANDGRFFDDEVDDEREDETDERPRPGPADAVRIIGAQEARAAYDEERRARFPLPGDEEDEAEPSGDELLGGPGRPPVGGRLLGEREGTPVVDDRPTGAVDLPHWTEPPSGEVLAATGLGREESEDTGLAPSFRDSESDWQGSDMGDLGEDAGVQARDEPALDDDDAFAREVEARRQEVRAAREAGVAPPPPPGAAERFSSGVRRVGPEGAAPPDAPARPVAPGSRSEGRASASPGKGAPGQPAGLSLGPGQPSAEGAPRGEAGGRPRGEGMLEPGMPEPAAMGSGGAERDVPTAILVGVAIGVAALVVFNLGRGPTAWFVAAIATLASAELYAAIRARGYKPAAPVGLAATAGLVLASYDRFYEGFALVLALAVITTFVWFLMRAEDARPVLNAALTLLPIGYVGLMAAYAGFLLALPNGIGILLGVAIAVVAYDVFGYFIGSRIGTRRIAPNISPNKTSEGLIAGMVGAVLASLLIVRPIHPWDGGSAFWLGVVVGVAAPLGDLIESMLKRDMALKDFGTLIPGHGGVLDRFDALLFALPPVFYLVRVLEIF